MHRRILSLALPNIVTNITIPLLGMVDMAIVGHLSPAHIGGATIGAAIFNLIYWNFGFLRMGTSGFTAQAYGAGNFGEAYATLARALAVALIVAAGLIALQWPLSLLIPVMFSGSNEVMRLALTYFFIRIWAAPATLGLYAIKGWFIGMQDSRTPMWIALFLNLVNIGCSLLFVLVMRWDMEGVALGTVAAQYSGLALGLILLVRKVRSLPHSAPLPSLRNALRWREMKQFFAVNGDIFLRTVCLSGVFTFITAASGRMGDQVLAIDALLLQFFTLFSYAMDGFAYAGESLVGRYIGARDPRSLRQSVRCLLLWGLTTTACFTTLYALGGTSLLHLFTSDSSLIAATMAYLPWVLAIPICGFAAFLFDGIYVGATAARTMRNSMFAATALFFLLYFGLKSLALHGNTLTTECWNSILWFSFLAYLSTRGLLLAALTRTKIYPLAQ
ncbi:MAG: MATE family efflux transporter [Bacteroidales bacterium]|nr:MATE family efflux transporter [Bacteroidales bacterium]